MAQEHQGLFFSPNSLLTKNIIFSIVLKCLKWCFCMKKCEISTMMMIYQNEESFEFREKSHCRQESITLTDLICLFSLYSRKLYIILINSLRFFLWFICRYPTAAWFVQCSSKVHTPFSFTPSFHCFPWCHGFLSLFVLWVMKWFPGHAFSFFLVLVVEGRVGMVVCKVRAVCWPVWCFRTHSINHSEGNWSQVCALLSCMSTSVPAGPLSFMVIKYA